MITQEYLWTLERNLDCMPEVTVTAGARSAYSSSMCSIPTASQHCTLEVPLLSQQPQLVSGLFLISKCLLQVPMLGTSGRGSGSCLSLAVDSDYSPGCKVKEPQIG